jgi:hypothetical protein
VERVRLAVARALARIQLARRKRRVIAGFRSAPDDAGILEAGNCERNSTRPFATASPSSPVIREVQERPRRRELLALEEHRRRRSEEQPRRHRAVLRGRRQLVQAPPERRVRHLIVVLEVVHERVREEIDGRRAAPLVLPAVPLALIQVAPPRARDQFLRRAQVVAIVRSRRPVSATAAVWCASSFHKRVGRRILLVLRAVPDAVSCGSFSARSGSTRSGGGALPRSRADA